jgi:hypothetical protein
MHSMVAMLGLALAPSLAAAAEGEAAQLTEPAGPTPASADPTPAPADTGAAEAAPASQAAPSTLINLDVEAASAYVWRGINLYGEDQNTQNFSLFPSLTATFGGLSIGYFAGFQLTGDNKSDVVDQGTGAQQTLILKYSGSVTEQLNYSAGLVYWVYPFADPDVANTDLPMYIEPGVGVTYATAPVDVGLYTGYYRALQDVNEAASFVYINPSVSKSLPLTADIDLALGLAAGFKAYTNLASGQDGDRVFDLTLNVGARFPFSDMYVTPQLHAAFVTRADDLDPVTPGNQGAEFGDQFVAWAGVHVGYDVGL